MVNGQFLQEFKKLSYLTTTVTEPKAYEELIFF